MSPLMAALLAERARLGPRSLSSLKMAASARSGAAVITRVVARSAATDAGPPHRGAPTSEDEEHKLDSYGAMPASAGGQPQPPSKEALREFDVDQAETQPPFESERTEPGVRDHDARLPRGGEMPRIRLGGERCGAGAASGGGAGRRHAPRQLLTRRAQVHVHAGSPLPGGAEGVEVTNALPGRPRGAGAPFEQRRGP